MRKYLTIKNAIITMFATSIYYKCILDEISMASRIFGTVVILVILMWCLQKADDCFIKQMKLRRNTQ